MNLLIYLIALSFPFVVVANRMGGIGNGRGHKRGAVGDHMGMMHNGRGMNQLSKLFGSETGHPVNLLQEKRKSRRASLSTLSNNRAGNRPKYGINYRMQTQPEPPSQLDHRTQLLAFHNRQRVPNHTLGQARQSQGWPASSKQSLSKPNPYKSEWDDGDEFIELSHTGSTSLEEDRARRNKAISERLQQQQKKELENKKPKEEQKKPQVVEFNDIFKDFNLEIPGYNVPAVNQQDTKQKITNSGQNNKLDHLIKDDFDLDKFLSDDQQVKQFLDSAKHL